MVVSLMTFTLVLMQRWVNLGFVIHSFFYFKLHGDMSSAMTRAIWQALNPQDWCRFKLKCLLYSSDSMGCAIICSVKIMASCSQLSSHSVEPAAVQINRRMFCLGNPLEKRPRTNERLQKRCCNWWSHAWAQTDTACIRDNSAPWVSWHWHEIDK